VAEEKTREQQVAELREQRSKFRSLVQSPGWEELVRVATAQALARENPVLRNATTPENVGEHNFMKGEAAGMRALMVLPLTVIESADEMLKDEDES
jgi:hypothetical protein